MIQSVGARAITAPDTPSTRGAHDDDAPASFAGILAGVMTAAQQPQAAKKPDGTSELDAKGDHDAPEGTASDDKSTGDAKTATTTPTTTSSAADVVRSIAALDPQLQAKLARLMQRVRDETGHDVQVVETYRSQARQNVLYEQGRETPGPVVTWTTSSKHTQGRAVDVMLDGGTAGPDAYAALQRIAREEGLRTLGARDPGHLELPGTAPASAATGASALMPAAPADATGPGQVPITNLAKLAQVSQASVESNGVQQARVARVAQVATVTPVAPPARVASVAAVATVNAVRTHTSGNSARGETSDRGAGNQQSARTPYSALGTTFTTRDTSALAPAPVAADVGSTAAARAEHILATLDSAPARPMSQITMSVDAGNGTSDRIQVAMRGTNVNATIDAADPRAAHAMSERADELVRALSHDGVEVDSLRVRAASTAAQTVVQAPQNGSGTSMHSRFERGAAWEQSRQRSQDERRQQQRQARGGRKQ